MSDGPMRITDDELAREVEALKSHRRLSVNRPVLDPDLPDLAAAYGGGQELLSVPSPERERRGYSLVDDGAVPIRSPSSSSSTSSLSPAKSYTNERARFTARRRGQGSDHSSGSEHLVPSPTRLSPVALSPSSDAFDGRNLATSPTSITPTSPQSPKDPSHLFWVPASVHPEISPSDFRNFIKEHAARAVTQHQGLDDVSADNDILSPLTVGDSPIAQRLNSVRRQQQQTDRQHASHDARGALIGRATSISRRASTLRRQYRPENDTDDTDDDKAPRPLERNRSALSRGTYGLAIPNLTIDDLQKLEEAAEQASQSQDPAMLRSVLRRTLSLNTTPDLDTIDAMPVEPVEDPDAPIIVPKPGQILRRAARTKMRKASGDSTRGSLASRRRAPRSSTDADASTPSEGSRAWELQRQSSTEEMERRHSGQSEVSSGADDDSSAGDTSSRPVSTEAADSIVDAYSRDSYQSDISQRTSFTSVVDSTGSDASASAGAISNALGRAELNRSSSPPLTPTQESVATLSSVQPYPPRQDATRTPDALETPRSDHIKPIPVSHRPPVPSFEKTLPHQQQQKQAARSTSSTAVAESQRRDDQPAPPSRPQIAPIITNQQQQAPQRPPQPVPPLMSSPPPFVPSTKQKEKERKGAFGLSWFGLGKDDEDDRAKVEKESQRKKDKHEKRERKEREREEKEREESSSSSFLGALFGKKKGHDESSHHMGPRPMNGQLTAGSLLERSEMGTYGKGNYSYARYPIHIERAVYRLSHIKLANPRRPLYEQVLISNLMFWYLSIINRSNQGQSGAQQQGQMQPGVGNSAAQVTEQSGLNMQGSAGAGANGYANAASPHADTASAYDGMEVSSSPESEDQPSAEQRNGLQGGGGGNGAVPKQKRNGLVKPNRAPAGARGGRTAEMPMKQPGYGMQHRQIDDDLKTMGSHSGQLGGGSSGFVVGQVVDVKALQANTPYRLVADPRTGDAAAQHDQPRSATTDYLGLGNQFESSEPLWPGNPEVDGESARSPQSHAGRPGSAGPDGTQQAAEEYQRGSQRKHSSSGSRPYRSEAEKERAWLGMRNNSGRASPTHGYGSISQQQQQQQHQSLPGGAESYVHDTQRRSERAGAESHPQGRSMSVGGIGAMNRTGDWGSGGSNSNGSSGSSGSSRPVDRSRKTSMDHMSASASSQGLVSSTSASSSSSFGIIDENAGGKAYGGMTSSSSTSALDYAGGAHREFERPHTSQINLPIAPGSSAMLDAARTSQSRRR
ncbi:potential regulator of cell polarity [Pseudozyma hubeiensis SY62]|uniref:Potential regulator of cell polarity n=1 Tax=Pseudozyma hubeiensis (strain SY62) TaxID=1305764 RepID=R9NXX9_PSEHS|nr:potential regulator of cell polarity [Pseudozyma hubeiensis SY62]GAC93514.1 potential regulator of cell polarity [Pseudozyma hubeiensis SY62]